MRYLFVLGRNIELSLAEVLNFLKRFDNPAKKYTKRKNAILVEVNNKLGDNAIDKLGGVIAIGEVLDLEKSVLYYGSKNSFNYIIWDFSDKTEKYIGYLKERFREEKLKATRKLRERKGFKTIDEQYFVFDDYFGRITQSCDYEELEKRDMKKPVRREALAISPRLSKIMINLSQTKKNLVDPFCGIGGVLFEALLQELEVIGIEIDPHAINGAKKNLEWGKFPKEKYQLITGNSKTVKIKDSEVIVTEPDLGRLVRKSPKQKDIDLTMKNFENLMVGVLNNLKRRISGRMVFTSPHIKRGCNINYILSKTGLKLVEGPFLEFREGKIGGRAIFVLG